MISGVAFTGSFFYILSCNYHGLIVKNPFVKDAGLEFYNLLPSLGAKMKIFRNGAILTFLLISLCICFINETKAAQTTKTSVSAILKNPDKYDGKMVRVEGIVESVNSRKSEGGNPYTTLTIRDSSGGSLNVFRMGRPPVRNGDAVVVIGRFQKIKRAWGVTFYSEIDATDGSLRKTR